MLRPLHKTRGAGTAERPSSITETTILALATRPAASLAACLLLSCVPAPAWAGQPASAPPAACAAFGKSCPASGFAARPRTKQQAQCARLRAVIQEAEHSERRVRAMMIESVQLDLLILRKRYRKLGCRTALKA